jgi:hypothetical protein
VIDLAPPPLWLPSKPAIIRAAQDFHPPTIAMVPGIAPPLVGRTPTAAPVDISVVQALTIQPVETQTVTWSGVNFEAADANRYIFISVPYYHLGTTAYQITSATIGGVAATVIRSVCKYDGGPGNCQGAAVICALVPTGTSGTVTVTLSNNATFRPRICVYRVLNLQSANEQSGVSFTVPANAPTTTQSVTGAKDGFVLTAVNTFSNTAPSLSGVTQDYSVSIFTGDYLIGGSKTVATDGTISATYSGGSNGRWVGFVTSFR